MDDECTKLDTEPRQFPLYFFHLFDRTFRQYNNKFKDVEPTK